MQPQHSEHQGGPEQLPLPPAPAGERIPVLPSPEAGIETGAERREQTADAAAAVADAAATSTPTPIADPTQTSPVTPVQSSGLVAAVDEDVIDKEWVDKAKQIVSGTKDDPHQRSTEVATLQKEYLQKRFNKELGK